MPLRGKRSVAGSSFHELQIAPELFTTGRRLQRPDTHTEKENTHTSDTDMVVCVCVYVSDIAVPVQDASRQCF